jgi:nucleoside phosphorylase
LEKNKITIHQAFYGEVNRSHSCIKQTIADTDLTSFLIAFTDRPAALPPGFSLAPYLSGSAYSKYYILTKTFPDLTASRSGMVFTHALILDIADVIFISNLQNILPFFVESPDNKNDELMELQIDRTGTNYIPERKFQPKYIQQTISAYIRGTKPILFSGDNQTFSKVLEPIWHSPNLESRKKLKFRTSFTPSDLENVDDLTIVSIQKDFLSKWQGHAIIRGDDNEEIEITSYSEAAFLGYKEGNPFYIFLVELNINLADIQNFEQYERLYKNYISIDEIDDANIIRQDIRILTKISPSNNDGDRIKKRFIERLSTLIEIKKDANLKALRNIEWAAFKNGNEKGKQIVSQFIEREFENPKQEQLQILSELIDLSVNEIRKNWWHNSITETINAIFKNKGKQALICIWQLIDISESTLKNIVAVVGNTKDCDVILRGSLPDKLKIDTYKTLMSISRKRDWYLLHADILLKQFAPEIALEKQLEVEQKLSLSNSIGVNYLSEKLLPESLISVTLKLCDDKLIDLSVKSIIKHAEVLKKLDLSFSCWLDIWTSVVIKTKNIFNSLEGKEQKTVFSILDLILKGKRVNNYILELISDTPFSDISEYKSRDKVWSVLPHSTKEKFLISTTQSVLEMLLLGKIQVNSIELEIYNNITSDSYMTKFLSEHRNNIDPIITVYENFTNLRDVFLADYINYYRDAISDMQAERLGRLVLSNGFKKSARSIYDKAKYNRSFNTACEICEELIDFNWLESMWGTVFARREPHRSEPIFHASLTSEQMIRKELPTVVILTAINEEYKAVRNHLTEIVEADQNDTAYEAGIFEFNGMEIAKVFIRECGAKNTTASQEAERAIHYFTPNIMLFVGIAGSRKPNDFSIGDVIFPEKVYSYEGGRSEKNAFVARPDAAFMSYPLMEIAKKERRKENWKHFIKGTWDQDVKADLGVIASGEVLVEHYDSGIGKIITKHYNDTSAVEMEGFGFAKAANRQGRGTSNMLIGVVRGISDVIEQPSKKKETANVDRRPPNAKQIASDTAAAFAYWLIFKLYEST